MLFCAKKQTKKKKSSFSHRGKSFEKEEQKDSSNHKGREVLRAFCLIYTRVCLFSLIFSHRRMEEFNDPHFDPIHYVNVAARQCFNDEKKKKNQNQNLLQANDNVELERLLSELEMRLQLLGEDISLQLERESQLGVKRIPTAIGEIEVLEENVESLTNTVKNISRSLDETEFPSKQSIERLRKIDEVKSRMERARDTLSEAAGLAELMHSVDSVFNGENVSNMADALVRMKRGLAIVGDVPEFADGRDRIAVLESRLESAARPALLRALEMDKGVNMSSSTIMVSSSGSRDSIKFARDARDALRSIGKNESIEAAYAEARVVSPAMVFWVAFEEKTYNDGLIMNENSPPNDTNSNNDKKTDEDAANEAFANFLPQFYDFVISLIEKEVNWTKSTFPEDVATLVSAGVASLHRAIAKKMQKRLDTLCYGSYYGDGANSNTNFSSSTNNNNDGENNADIGADLENMMRCRVATTRYATRLCGALEPCVRKMVTAAMKETASGEDDGTTNALDESYLMSSSDDEDDDFRNRFTSDVDAANGANTDGTSAKGDGSNSANNKKSKKREKVAAAVQKFTEALSTVFIPFVKSEKVFPKLESIKLREEIVSLATSTVDADDFDGDFLAFSAAIEKTCKSASKSAMKSFVSCKEYSSGLETVAAVKSIDDSLTRFVKALEGRLKAVRIAIGLDKNIGGASSSSNKNPEDFIDASLSLLRATKSVPQTFADLDARASATLKQIANESSFANSGGATSDVDLLRAIGGKKHMDIVFSTQSRLDAGRSRTLAIYLEPYAESTSASAFSRNNSKNNDKSGILASAHSVFPRTADAAVQFRDACERLVRDCLLHRVRRELENIENEQIWTKMAAQTAHDLPTFSAYPQEKATNSGEYLLSLPTRLEALVNVVGDDVGSAASASAGIFGNDDEDEDLASIWMERVAEASATIFLERVKSIRRLSEPGAAQLAADLEYFSNVVTALTSRPQRGLLAYMQCASVDADDYARFARETVEQQQQQSAENADSSPEAFIDHRIVKQVAAMRGIAL